jgi:hypothetical protein
LPWTQWPPCSSASTSMRTRRCSVAFSGNIASSEFRERPATDLGRHGSVRICPQR